MKHLYAFKKNRMLPFLFTVKLNPVLNMQKDEEENKKCNQNLPKLNLRISLQRKSACGTLKVAHGTSLNMTDI
jgi:hypothetical protein